MATLFSNSVAISANVAILTELVNLLGRYALAQLKFRSSNVVCLIALTTLMIPVQVIMVPLYKLVTNPGLYGSY